MAKQELIALVDVNNCYASCERVFRPDLASTPIAVLSNNDGCIIARSDEVKAMGFKIGDPYFKNKELFDFLGVEVFSSNYAFYHDMTHRVFWTLKRWSPEVEIYSIDEAFMILTGFIDPEEYGRKVREDVLQRTKIPVSIGLAPTKTLAKLANHIAKKNLDLQGVFDISQENLEPHLQDFPIEDVWGIGRKYAKFLKNHHINTAYDLTQAPHSWVKQNLTVMGVRIQRELLGERILPLTSNLEEKKNIGASRSFGEAVTDLKSLKESVAEHVDHAAKKLRKQKFIAGKINVHIRTNLHNRDPRYIAWKGIELKNHTAYTPDLLRGAFFGLEQIYRKGYRYWKSGVLLSQLSPGQPHQQAMFDEPKFDEENKIMQTYDLLNKKHGKNSIRFASMHQPMFDQSWAMKREKLSPLRTTSWNCLPKIK